MAKVLYITANPKAEEHSFSLSVGREFVNAYKQQNPNDEVIELDLYKENIPYIDYDVFSGWGKLAQNPDFSALSAEEQAKVARINELTDQVLSADKYVFVTPLWNLSIPPMVKAYIDTICVAGKTFRYTEQGPEGLLKGRKVLHVQARGGVYSEGPAAEMEFGDRYLRTVMGFLGATDFTTLAIEGMAAMPQEADNIKANAVSRAKDLAQTF